MGEGFSLGCEKCSRDWWHNNVHEQNRPNLLKMVPVAKSKNNQRRKREALEELCARSTGSSLNHHHRHGFSAKKVSSALRTHAGLCFRITSWHNCRGRARPISYFCVCLPESRECEALAGGFLEGLSGCLKMDQQMGETVAWDAGVVIWTKNGSWFHHLLTHDFSKLRAVRATASEDYLENPMGNAQHVIRLEKGGQDRREGTGWTERVDHYIFVHPRAYST